MAAAAAAVAQALRAQIQADFSAVLMNIVRLTPAQIVQINNEGFLIGDDLTFIDEETLLDIFPEQPRNMSLTAMFKMRLKAFRTWTISQRQELANPDDDINVTAFDNLACARIQQRLVQKVKMDKEKTSNTMFSGTLTPLSGKMEDWLAAKRNALAYLGQLKNKNNVPYFHVVRDESEHPDVIEDDIQYALWNTAHQGTLYDLDNYHVYQILLQRTAGAIAETHVDMFGATMDGRGAFKQLRLNYKGTDYRQNQINNAHHVLNHAFYQ
jgi:hypothetical protein